MSLPQGIMDEARSMLCAEFPGNVAPSDAGQVAAAAIRALEKALMYKFYAPLRSAQHALDLIHKYDGIPLAKEESDRIEQAIRALRGDDA